MKRLLNFLKVNTLFNLKISAILIILGLSLFFGYKYLQFNEIERKSILVNIKENEDNSLKKTTLVNTIISTDGKLLSSSLNKEISNEDIKKDISVIRKKTCSIDKRLIVIINEKERIYQSINNFNPETIRFGNIKSNKNISIVSKNIKKSLFKTRIEYDTISKKYSDINQDLYYIEYNRVLKINSDSLNKLIYKNNELTLRMKLIIDEYSRNQINRNINDNQVLLDKLRQNANNFIIKSFILAIVVVILLYLIVIDIKKIKKNNQRNSEVISILMEKTKKSIIDKNKK